MSKKSENIAVFIDGDNISPHHYQQIINEVKKNGRVLIQRLYADFTRPNINGWRDIIVNYGIEAVQTFRVGKKESTDNSLIVDCMRALYHLENIESFVIISSDSDFSSLAGEIRLRARFCVGIGYKHTPLKLQNNCDKFIMIESLLDDKSKAQLSKIESKKIHVETGKGLQKYVQTFFDKYPKSMPLEEFIKISSEKYNMNSFTPDELIKLNTIRIYGDRIIYVMLNGVNVVDTLLKIIYENDRGSIFMSWLKEQMLHVDCAFDQRIFGFQKIYDFVQMGIEGERMELQKDKNNETVVVKL